jgi:cardiolipin synthase A/B
VLRPSRAALAVAVVLLLAACGASRPPWLAPEVRIGDRAFARAIEAHTLAAIVPGNDVEILLNGDEIFPAMLAAIRSARTTITLATYLYEDGTIADEIAHALAERCRAGVGVAILVDAVGSHRMSEDNRDLLRRSGCHLERFHPVSALNPRRVNRRNHRRVLVVDGRIAFTGGTGIGTKWTGDGRQARQWRQTDVRVEGPIVAHLQAAFAELWRETTGILLGGDAHFPELEPRGRVLAQSVKSSPTGGNSEAYALFLLAVESARTSIALSTPYFVPDARMRTALVNAAARGVRVAVLVNGVTDNTPDRLTRRASQQGYGAALAAGIRIYEPPRAMMHAKTLIVDGVFANVGSVNLDPRSFGLNHELTLVIHDAAIARRLEDVFAEDVREAREITRDTWKRRGLGRVLELIVLPFRNAL